MATETVNFTVYANIRPQTALRARARQDGDSSGAWQAADKVALM